MNFNKIRDHEDHDNEFFSFDRPLTSVAHGHLYRVTAITCAKLSLFVNREYLRI